MADYRENSSYIEISKEQHGQEVGTVNSKITDDSSPKLILEDTKTVVAVGNANTQTSEPNVRSGYTPLIIRSLDSYQNPQSSHYEELNYCKSKPPTDK